VDRSARVSARKTRAWLEEELPQERCVIALYRWTHYQCWGRAQLQVQDEDQASVA